jgi:hypothetical protein
MISAEEFVERLCLLGVGPGTRGLPRKRRDRQILMKSILMGLDSSRVYGEEEINQLLRDWHRELVPAIETDHVTVRRLLVDHGHLERTADGRAYRVGFPPASVAFELDVEDLDLRATVAAYRDHLERRSRRPRD